MAFDEIEGGAADGGCGDGGGRVAVVAEGTDATVDAEPDHDFVGLSAGGTGAEEGVVGDVGAEGGPGVAIGIGISLADSK